MELAILDWIQTHLRCEFLDAVLPAISWTCNHGELWIVLAVVLLLIRRQRRYGLAVACGLILDLISCNVLLKPLVGRIRPFAVNTAVELLVTPPLDASFPSGHTAASFAAVFALLTARSPLWKPSLALAIGIAFSRLLDRMEHRSVSERCSTAGICALILKLMPLCSVFPIK